jgi:tetratricopeptide (TPR) repeat protein
MAVKINTRFVLILFTICGAVAIGVGIVGYLAIRENPYLNIRRGEEAMAEGNFRAAAEQFGKACNKAPSNVEYLDKYEQALLAITPATESEAGEQYQKYLAALQTRARILASEADTQLRLLNELMRYAETIGGVQAWSQVNDLALAASASVPSTSPGRAAIDGIRFRAAVERLAQATPTEIAALERELDEYTRTHPSNEAGIAAYGRFLLARSEQVRGARDTAEADRLDAALEALLRRAAESGVDGAPIAILNAQNAIRRWVLGQSQAQADLSEAARRLSKAADGADPAQVREAAWRLPLLLGAEGYARGQQLLGAAVKADPNDVVSCIMLCHSLFDSGKFDEARAEAERLFALEPLTTGMNALFRFFVRREAAKMLFDVEFIRVTTLPPAEQAEAFRTVHDARERLASVVPNRDNDSMLDECDGWLALHQGDFAVAAAKFDRVVRSGGRISNRSLLGASRAYEAVGSIGEAHRAMERLASQVPGSAAVSVNLARLEVRLARYDVADSRLQQVIAADPENGQARLMRGQIHQLSEGKFGEPTEAGLASAAAAEAESAGDIEKAHSLLLDAATSRPEDLSALRELTMFEVRHGMRDQSLQRLEAVQRQYSGNEVVDSLVRLVRDDDPVVALRSMIEDRFPDEASRAVGMFSGLRQMAEENRRAARLARSEGRTAEAVSLEEASQRFDRDAAQYAEVASRLAPNDPQYLNRAFDDAIAAGDFEEARLLAERARGANADQANGLLFRARLDMAGGDHRSAVIALREAAEVIPYSAWVWRTLGQNHQALGNFGDAAIAYQSALERQPGDHLTYELFTRLLVQAGRADEALQLIRSAMQIPSLKARKTLRDLWLDVESMNGNQVIAIAERRAIRVEDPDDLTNCLRLAALLGQSTPTRQTIVDGAGRQRFDEPRWISLRQSERDQYIAEQKTRWVAEAEELFDSLENKPLSDSLTYAATRAMFLRDTGRAEEGLTALLDFIASRDPAHRGGAEYVTTAQYLASIGRRQQAVDVLTDGVPYQSDESREVDHALGSLHFEDGRFAEAVKHFTRVAERVNEPSIQVQLIESLIGLGRFDEAERELKRIEAVTGVGYEAELLGSRVARGRAMVALQAGNTSEADRLFRDHRAAIERGLQLGPDRPEAHVLKATSLYEEYLRSEPRRPALLEEADRAISQALAARKAHTPALRMRAQLLLTRVPPDIDGAVRELQVILDANPRDQITRGQVVDLLARARRFDDAIVAAQPGVDLDATDTRWCRVMADLYSAKGEPLRSAEWWMRVYERDGRNSTWLRPWASEMLRSGDRQAIAAVVQSLRGLPQVVAAVPSVQMLFARALLLTGDRAGGTEQAGAAFREYSQAARDMSQPDLIREWFELAAAFPLSAADLESIVSGAVGGAALGASEAYWLAELLKGREDGRSRADELYTHALSLIPTDDRAVRARSLLGRAQGRYLAGENETAIADYRAVLEIEPGNGNALNDLAYTLVDRLGRPNDALPFAQKAVQIEPENASFLDTLGAVYLAQKDYGKAEETLRLSIAKGPQVDNHVHLAQVLIATDRRAEAQKMLEDALRLRPSPAREADIRRLLTDISS